MSLVTACPSCGRKLRVPEELLGKVVKCTSCGQPFRAVTESAAEASPGPPPKAARQPVDEDEAEFAEDDGPPRPPEDEDDIEGDKDRPKRRPKRDRAQNWRMVRMGLRLELWSIALRVLGVPLAILVAGLFLFLAAPRAPQIVDVKDVGGLAVLAVVLGLADGITALIGIILCVWAPPRYNAKKLAIANLVLPGVVIALAALLPFLPVPVRFMVRLLVIAAVVAEKFVFLFFLRAVARCFRARDLEDSVGRLINFTAMLLALSLPCAGLSLIPCIGFIVVLVALGLALAWLIRYIRVLLQAQAEISYYLARR